MSFLGTSATPVGVSPVPKERGSTEVGLFRVPLCSQGISSPNGETQQ